MEQARTPNLVLRFVAAAFVAFLVVGAAQSLVLTQQLRANGERAVEAHAQFVTNSILEGALREVDVTDDLSPADRARLLHLVRSEILGVDFPVRRIQVWSPNGEVVFSDEPRSVGQVSSPPDLSVALAGRTVSRVLPPGAHAARPDLGPGPKLLDTFVPLDGDGGTPRAVVEVLTDYAGVNAEVGRLRSAFLVTLLAGLAVLYVLLLPIASRASRTLRDQNALLRQLLEKEQAAIAELREANKAKDEFLAVVSHELRTPLTGVIGYLTTLSGESTNGDEHLRAEFVSGALRQAHHLREVVENLLTASLIERDRFELSLAPLGFQEVAHAAVAALGPRGARLRLRIPEGLRPVISDRRALMQILVNLLDNALKFSSPDSPCTLGARNTDDGLLFWVKDRGIGISEADLGRVFDRFYQADGSATRTQGGLGLGLSVVSQLLPQLGGGIEVKSRPGKGSTFEVWLPARHPVARSDVASAAHTEAVRAL
jgi:signal transduction histidine kinase